jgi:large subunit ribosomal protein L22
MFDIKSQLNYLRIAPRKIRGVVDLIRGKEIREAERQLKFLSRRPAHLILRALKSAIANAKSNFNLERENLFIKNILVNQGVPYKRWRAMSRGRAYPIMKRTSNIILILGVKEGAKISKKSPASLQTQTAGVSQSESLGEKETKVSSKPGIKKPSRETEKKIKSLNWVKRIFRRKSM